MRCFTLGATWRIATAALLLAVVALGMVALQPTPAAAQAIGGVWSCDDGGTYYIRQIGNTVWWSALSGDGGATWSHVFHGQRSGQTISGSWADVPMGQIMGSGTLQLRVESGSVMVRLNTTGSGYGCAYWTR